MERLFQLSYLHGSAPPSPAPLAGTWGACRSPSGAHAAALVACPPKSALRASAPLPLRGDCATVLLQATATRRGAAAAELVFAQYRSDGTLCVGCSAQELAAAAAAAEAAAAAPSLPPLRCRARDFSWPLAAAL
jgi:hypothetical protein